MGHSLKIEYYSDKSFAVIGETKPVKEDLKKLGGKWNSRLKCGPGWIFPMERETDVREYIENGTVVPSEPPKLIRQPRIQNMYSPVSGITAADITRLHAKVDRLQQDMTNVLKLLIQMKTVLYDESEEDEEASLVRLLR